MWDLLLLPLLVPLSCPWPILDKIYKFQTYSHHGIKCPLVMSDKTNSLASIFRSSDNPNIFLNIPQLPSSLYQKKWLPHCETVIISFEDLTELVNVTYSNRNYHIFYSTSAQIHSLFYADLVKNLKFSLGVSSDSVQIEGDVNFSANFIRNAHLRISIWKLDPWYAEVPDETGKLVPYGVHYNLLPKASQVYNFTYIVKVHPPRFHMLPNGTWMGVMHDLQVGSTDLVISLGPTIDRLTISIPGTIMYAIELAFMLKIPTPSVTWTAFLIPFTGIVWLSTIVTTLTVATLGWILLKVSGSTKEPIKHAWLGTYSALLGQCSSSIPRVSVGAEILFSTWLFSSIVITTYYCSDILAAITIPQAQEIPLSFKQLVTRQDYNLQLWYFGGSLADRYFATATNPLYVEANKRIARTNSGPACAKQAGIQDKTVCITFNTLLDSMMAAVDFTEDEVQRILQVSDGTFSVYSTVLYEKNSKFFDDFDRIIGQVRDAGLFERWIKEFFAMRKHQNIAKRLKNAMPTRSSSSTTDDESKAKPFGIWLLLVPFEVLIFGLGLSTTCFLVAERKMCGNMLSCNKVQ